MEHWYVLFTKPRKEPQVYEQLLLKGLPAYLPLMQVAMRRRQQPLFPRYLFAHLDLTHILPDTVKWIPGLTGFVTFGDEYAVVDDTVIMHLERRLAQMHARGFVPFQPGQRVYLRTENALSELDAVFERPLSGGERAQILISFLGRLTRCEVEMSSLEAADALA